MHLQGALSAIRKGARLKAGLAREAEVKVC